MSTNPLCVKQLFGQILTFFDCLEIVTSWTRVSVSHWTWIQTDKSMLELIVRRDFQSLLLMNIQMQQQLENCNNLMQLCCEWMNFEMTWDLREDLWWNVIDLNEFCWRYYMQKMIIHTTLSSMALIRANNHANKQWIKLLWQTNNDVDLWLANDEFSLVILVYGNQARDEAIQWCLDSNNGSDKLCITNNTLLCEWVNFDYLKQMDKQYFKIKCCWIKMSQFLLKLVDYCEIKGHIRPWFWCWQLWHQLCFYSQGIQTNHIPTPTMAKNILHHPFLAALTLTINDQKQNKNIEDQLNIINLMIPNYVEITSDTLVNDKLVILQR